MWSSDHRPEPRATVLLAGALAVVALAYSNVAEGAFVWDDWVLIREASHAHSMDVRQAFTHAFWREGASAGASGAYYRPVVALSYAADWVRSDGDARAFHLTNLLLHLIACGLFAAAAVRLGASPRTATLGAAIVGVLPRLTESVTWISGRTDVLAAVFTLGAVALHSSEPGAHSRRALAAVLSLLALLSKEVAVAGLLAIVVLEVRRAGPLRGAAGRVALNVAPMVAAAGIYAALRGLALAGAPPPERLDLGPTERALAPVQAFGAYVLMALDPLRPRLQIGRLAAVDPMLVAVGAAGSVAVALGLVRCVRRGCRPEVLAAITLSFTALALVLHLVPLGVAVIASDRFLYFPALGAGLAVVVGWTALGQRTRRVLGGMALVLSPVLALATYVRNRDWADEVMLWRETVRTAPRENVLPQVELGNALFRRGRYEEAHAVWSGALPFARGGDRIAVRGNLASALSELGRYAEAREITLSLRDAEPHLALHEYNLGIVEARLLDLDAAEAALRRALRILPDYPLAANALEALRAARVDLARLPPEARDESTTVRAARAAIDERLGRRQEAERRWTSVLGRDDRSPEQTWRAAKFLLSRGSHEGAEAALHELERARLASYDEIAELRAERRRRELDGFLATST